MKGGRKMELWEVIAFFQDRLHTAEAMESWCSMKEDEDDGLMAPGRKHGRRIGSH